MALNGLNDMKTDTVNLNTLDYSTSFSQSSVKHTEASREQKEPTDPIWMAILREARTEEQAGSCLCLFLNKSVLEAAHLEEALSGILSSKLATPTVTEDRLQSLILHAFAAGSTFDAPFATIFKRLLTVIPWPGDTCVRSYFSRVSKHFKRTASLIGIGTMSVGFSPYFSKTEFPKSLPSTFTPPPKLAPES